MHVTTCSDAAAFLRANQPALEASAAVNALLLGICLRLVRYPDRVPAPPRLVAVYDDGQDLALAAVLIPPWNVVLSGARGAGDAAAGVLAAALVAEGDDVPGVQGPADVAAPVAAHLAAATRRTPRLERCEHLYELRAALPGPGPEDGRPAPIAGRPEDGGHTSPPLREYAAPGGRLRPAAAADAPLVARWWYGSSLAAFGRADAGESDRVARRCLADGDVYIWDVGRPVSMAVRAAITRTGVTIGRVYTPPEERGRGYATACVAAISRHLMAGERDHCTLFVEASNRAAQRVYLRVGYRPVCEFYEIALQG